MEKKLDKTSLSLSATEIAIGVGIVLCLLLCMLIGKLGYQVQTLAAGTAVVMCTQDTGKASWKAGLTRVLGVISGGVVGIILVAIDNAVQIPVIFYVLCGVAIVANFFVCKLLKINPIQARVSCITLLLVVLVVSGNLRFTYALSRFIGTICGAVTALVVSMLFAAVLKKKQTAQSA